MSNMVRIEMQKEFPAIVSNGEIIECKNSKAYDVYACCDKIKAWIGYCETIEGLENIVSEENLIESINGSCSNNELDIILPVLNANDLKYDFFGTIRTAISEDDE